MRFHPDHPDQTAPTCANAVQGNPDHPDRSLARDHHGDRTTGGRGQHAHRCTKPQLTPHNTPTAPARATGRGSLARRHADMYERNPAMPTPPTAPPPHAGTPKGYPGRPELDAANARFRRALSRLWREGTRHDDPDTRAAVGPIAAEAAATLDRLATAAEQAEHNSARHRTALAAEEAKLARLERRLGRRIGPERPSPATNGQETDQP